MAHEALHSLSITDVSSSRSHSSFASATSCRMQGIKAKEEVTCRTASCCSEMRLRLRR